MKYRKKSYGAILYISTKQSLKMAWSSSNIHSLHILFDPNHLFVFTVID